MKSFSPGKAIALPFFHAFTGCDTVSYFHSKGKKSCWKVWHVMDEATEAFNELLRHPETLEKHMSTLERFVVLLYDRTSPETAVNSARKIMFAQQGIELEKIPPTRDALVLHTKRAIMQASHCWSHTEQLLIDLPSPKDWGWTKEDTGFEKWTPVWTTLPPAVESCSELLKCGFTKGCSRNCHCKKAELPCTALCKCDGQC